MTANHSAELTPLAVFGVVQSFRSDLLWLALMRTRECGNTGEGDALVAMLTVLLQERSSSDILHWIIVIFIQASLRVVFRSSPASTGRRAKRPSATTTKRFHRVTRSIWPTLCLNTGRSPWASTPPCPPSSSTVKVRQIFHPSACSC